MRSTLLIVDTTWQARGVRAPRDLVDAALVGVPSGDRRGGVSSPDFSAKWPVSATVGPVPHPNPAVALTTCEQALRQLMQYVFGEHYGPQWVAKVAKATELERWREKADVESRKRLARGVPVVSADSIDYAELYQLRALLDTHWHLFAEALGDRRRTGSLLARFDDLRNTVAHSRPLLPFEADLLAGIAGEIRNRVTIFMTTQGPGGDYHARIESVRDGFGYNVDGAESIRSSNPAVHTGLERATAATLRRKVFTMLGRLVHTGRRRHLRLPARWPWAEAITTALDRIHAMPLRC